MKKFINDNRKKYVNFIISFVLVAIFILPLSTIEVYATDDDLSFSITGIDNYDYAYSVLDSLNETRKSLGLNELKMDKELLDIAMQRAAEISIYFSHTRPDNTSCFSLASGYYGALGENIAIGQKSPQNVMTSWTNSSGHYANMIDADYNSVGIGCFKASNGVYCWVQFFSSEEADVISKSGTVEASHNITALYCNLALSLTPSSVSFSSNQNGDKFNLTVVNKNVGFSYVVQKLDASNFDYSSSDSSIVSVENSGECVVNGEGEAVITLSLKSNSKIAFSCPVQIAHNHNYSEWITDQEASVYAEGSRHKECTVCGEILETETIPQFKCSKPTIKSIENTEYGVLTKWDSVSGADRYRVYRKTSVTDWIYIGYTTKTYYTDKTAESGTKYYYSVRAINEAGVSSRSSSRSKYHLEDPTLNTLSTTSKGVGMRWSKVTGAQGYMIYRRTTNGDYSIIAIENGVSNLDYRDTTAQKGIKYYYKVKAYKSSTYSAYSNTKTITDKY